MEDRNLFFIEVLILSVILSLFYFLSPGFEVFSRFQPHPVYILATLMAMRRGNLIGIVLAFWLSFLYIGFQFIEFGSLEGFFADAHNAVNISITFLGAAIFGLGYDKYRAEVLSYTEFLTEATQALNTTSNENVKLHRLYDDLRSQVINSENSILSLYEINKKFKTFDEEELYTELLGVLQKFLKTKNISVYSVTNSDYLRLKVRIQTDDLRYSFNLKEMPELRRVIEGETLRRIDVEKVDFPEMTAPIYKGDRVVAIVNIDKIGFSEGNEYSYQMFQMIVEWFSNELYKISRLPDIRIQYYYKDTLVLKFEKFAEKLEQQNHRLKEYDLEYLYIKFKLDITIDDLDKRVAKKFREVDIISYDVENMIVHILLPATLLDNLEIIEQKIAKLLM